MLTLKDISLYPYFYNLDRELYELYSQNKGRPLRKDTHTKSSCNKRIMYTLKKYGIYDCQMLLEHIKSGHPDFQDEAFLVLLNNAEAELEKINSRDYQLKLYRFDTYSEFKNHKHIFEYTDALVSCDKLPIFDPISQTAKEQNVSKFSIAMAKKLLGQYSMQESRNGTDCAFSRVIPRTGPKFENDIVEGIRMYESQIIRTFEEQKDVVTKTDNLFEINSREKEEEVTAQIQDIILFLLNEDCDFIWGFLSNNCKKVLKECINPTTAKNRQIRKRLISVIKNYVTLTELKSGITDGDVLKRFLLTPKKDHEEMK